MRSNIEEVNAERQKANKDDYDHRMNVPTMTVFPYTHGDTVDAARQQIKEEMQLDLQNKLALMEAQERDRLGQEKYDELQKVDNNDNQKEAHLQPQGNKRQSVLREKFQQAAPFYLKHNKPVFARKANPHNYESALAQARVRFESQLKTDQDHNQKNLDEYQQYIDETSKFQELKALKEAQNKLIVRSVLEMQMEQDREKKLESRQKRRDTQGGELTFGPKETPETLMFQHLKKQQDTAHMMNQLTQQMHDNKAGSDQGRVQQILMDKTNMNMVQREIEDQQAQKVAKKEQDKQILHTQWDQQNQQRKMKFRVDKDEQI